MNPHPCQTCGACCAFFRASFHWSETLTESYHVPVELTEVIAPYQNAMTGTGLATPLCVALKGVIGKSVACSVYENRPSCCRSFSASFEDGFVNERCDQARLAKDLVPLTRLTWLKF